MKRRQFQRWLCCIGLALWAGAALAQEPMAPVEEEEREQESQEPRTVEERLDDLDQRLRVLDRKAELEKEQAAERAKTAGAATASARDGFSLRSADGAFVLRLRGYVQFDGRFFQDDEQRPGVDTFLLRRVRPILEGTLFKNFDYRVMPDFGGGTTVLQDAYLDARVSPRFRIRAGKYKPPVGLERLQSGTDILFVERALPTNLVPNRDLGIQLHGDLPGGLNYAVGVFNGVPDLGSADTDSNSGKDVAARLFFTPFAAGTGPFKNLGLGIAASQGSQEGTLTATGLPAYRTPAQQTFFSYRSDGTAAGTAVADGDRTRLSPQGYFYRGPFGLMAEYVRSSHEVRRGAVSEELEHDSWQVSTSWVLAGGGEPSFRAVNPKKPFDLEANTWGAFEVAARYSVLELDEATFPLFANPASAASSAEAWAVGLNWYLSRNLRLYLDYEQTEFEDGAATGDRKDEKILFSRFQISF
jgi:phosphate-selective porin OprO/OprP